MEKKAGRTSVSALRGLGTRGEREFDCSVEKLGRWRLGFPGDKHRSPPTPCRQKGALHRRGEHGPWGRFICPDCAGSQVES